MDKTVSCIPPERLLETLQRFLPAWAEVEQVGEEEWWLSLRSEWTVPDDSNNRRTIAVYFGVNGRAQAEQARYERRVNIQRSRRAA